MTIGRPDQRAASYRYAQHEHFSRPAWTICQRSTYAAETGLDNGGWGMSHVSVTAEFHERLRTAAQGRGMSMAALLELGLTSALDVCSDDKRPIWVCDGAVRFHAVCDGPTRLLTVVPKDIDLDADALEALGAAMLREAATIRERS